MKKCNFCGKTISGNDGEAVEFYVKGNLIGSYCSSACMSKSFKKTIRVLRKMKIERPVNTSAKEK